MKGRSVIELMVILFAAVVSFTILTGWIVIGVIKIRDPDADTDTLVQTLVSLISGILGALLGLIAGRTERVQQLSTRPGNEEPNGLGQAEDLEIRPVGKP